MESKLFLGTLFQTLILTLTLTLYFFTLSAATAERMIYISCAVPAKSPPIKVSIKVEGNPRPPISLNPGQESRVSVGAREVDSIFSASAIYGLKIAAFVAYNSSRDKGKDEVYWRATDKGFELSYGKSSGGRLMAPWETE